MRAAVSDLRDPFGLVLALATLLAARLVEPSLVLAVAAALAVLAIKALVAVLVEPHTLAVQPAAAAHGLTKREIEVCRLVEGHSDKEIAARLHIGVRTVENHLRNAREKLGFHDRSEIAAWIVRTGLSLPAEK